jgi:hypothetical protein
MMPVNSKLLPDEDLPEREKKAVVICPHCGFPGEYRKDCVAVYHEVDCHNCHWKIKPVVLSNSPGQTTFIRGIYYNIFYN